jgi:DNA-binding MarR family transcriptional regulator
MATRPTADDPLEARVVVAAKAVRRAFDAGLAELGLTMSEGGALGNLAGRGPLTQTELATFLHVGRASAGTVVDALESRGLVERRADPNDRRVWYVELTPTGAALAERFHTRHAQIRSALRQSMTAAEAGQLALLLGLLAHNASTYVDETAVLGAAAGS